MAKVLKKYDGALRGNNASYKRYIAPDIPDKITKKLINIYDSNLPVKSLVAFYDTSLFNSAKSGFVFTNDGMYHKFMEKPMYIQYSDIAGMRIYRNYLYIKINDPKVPEYKIIDSLEATPLKKTLEELKAIDARYGWVERESGKVKKLNLPPDIQKKCKAIIHTASVSAGGVGTGLAQIPLSDNAVIVPIQIGMIVSLGKVFELNITESAAKSIIASAGASIAGRSVTQVLWGWIPGLGNAINTATAAGLTEAIGWLAVKNFYERWIKDRNKGRLDAMKAGYVEASGEYERKLRKQAEEFLNQIKDVRREKEEYKKLLDEYEQYIRTLEARCAAADLIRETKEIYDKLKNLDA